MVNKPTLLNCKALIKLVKDSERTKSKTLLFCIVLIFAFIFMTFDRYLLDRWQKVTLETF